ncbi:MAG: tetratricopeptide repeat-containing sensor histidine kinase [Bacteroidales bacterium]|nr:tetratricopeptide repeat-containing sensor histidine kinase [Bacteroidales bacterium]
MKKLKIILLIFIGLISNINKSNADNIVDSLKQIVANSTELEQIVALNNLSDYYLDISLSEARKYAYQSIILSQKLNVKTEEAFSNKMLGYSYYYESNYDSSIFYFNKALMLYENEEYKKGMSDIYTALGNIHNKKGEIVQALELFNKSLTIDEELNNYLDKAITYNSIGQIYVNISDYSTALEYFEKSIEIFKKEKYDDGLANVYANIGNVYYDWEKYEEALVYIDFALEIFLKKDNKYKIAGLLSNKGMVYESMNEYNKSYECLNEALEINTEIDNKFGILNCEGNIAILKEKEKKYKEALNLYNQTLEIALEIDYEEGIISTYNSIGHLELLLKNYSSAKINIHKSLDLSSQNGMLNEMMISYENLAEIYNSTKEYEESIEYYQSYINIKDSIFKQQSLRQITEFNTKYELEKKENEIIILSTQNELQILNLKKQKNLNLFVVIISLLLIVIGLLIYLRFLNQRKNNKILENKNDQLVILNNTKDKFFSIIAHDLRNPLSAFKTITEALSENIKIIKQEDLEIYLNKLRSSSDSLYNLLQNLLQWASSQTNRLTSTPVILDLKHIVDKTITYLIANASEKNIILNNKIPENTNIFTDKKMIETIIRNLISNSIKFSKKNSEIKIYHKETPSYTNISIEDEGIGINETDLQKLFKIEIDTSTIGKSNEKGTGLGLILCKELVEKNNGKIFATSELGKGSIFTIQLPSNTDKK